MFLLVSFLCLAIFVSFLCSILEAVLLSVSPSYIHLQQQHNPNAAARLAKLKASIDKPLAAILTLNTIAHTAGAAGVGAQVASLYGSQYLAVSSAIMTILVLVLSEIVPKTLGVTYWRKLAPFASWLLPIMIKVFYPFVWLSDRITARIGKHEEDFSSLREEISALAELGHQQGVIEQGESQVLRNLLQLEKLKITEVMTPRAVVHRIEHSSNVDEFIESHLAKPFSRIPVYQGDRDNIVSYVHKQDIMSAALNKEGSRQVGEFSRELLMLPASVSIRHAYQRLLQARDLIAAVVNEYGEVQGLLTMEDIIETLLGQEITDESDAIEDMQRLARFQWIRRLRSKKQRYSR
ncbi:CNNM domain-containing protein [Agarivorans sp. 1_MG-2023]|uniref:CNNM domain-containing protein n=1 Tax=Agarivorans sp. 1_MG-2023 TaxID=3062634 RepID=UPI0026E15B75|nr:hemolysin family protein [Agarivorans sp. 1_MG-2023]MDO6762705.1 hemolysin family protein [Agarivorans sp. 1_MG-2023]